MESWVLALYHGHSSRLLSENCITNSRCTASNCNCQYVSQFCSSDHDVASDCKNSMREKKFKHPQNLSLKEVKSYYRDKLPVGLLALGYITPSTSPEGPLFEICPSLNGISAFIFTTTSILFLALTKWYLSKSIFTPQLKYVISIDSLLLYSPFTGVLRKLRYTDHFLIVVSLSQLQKYCPTIMGSSPVWGWLFHFYNY